MDKWKVVVNSMSTGEIVIAPEERQAKAGDIVVFDKQTTEGTVKIWFPDETLFHVEVVTIPSGVSQIEVNVDGSALPGIYPYSVYHKETRMLRGITTKPIIIITDDFMSPGPSDSK